MSDLSATRRDLSFLRLIAITDEINDGGNERDGGNAADRNSAWGELLARAAAAVRGGATCIQVRLKDAPPREIVAVTKEMVTTLGVPIIVNDRADLALAAGAAGVHLGPADLPVKAVRRIVPPEFVIGASFGDASEFENARHADYAGIGPIWVTSSKADAGPAIGIAGFRKLAARLDIPAIAVGGINAALARDLVAAGAYGIAVMSAIFGVSDPERAASELWSAIET